MKNHHDEIICEDNQTSWPQIDRHFDYEILLVRFASSQS
jgi:hypothetical protein